MFNKYRMNKPFRIIILLLFCHTTTFIYGQDSVSTNLEELSLEELLNINVTIASGKQDLITDAPGVVSIITSEEIRYSGARDLIDVLRKVPGLDFGQDIENLIGPAVRGLWAQEGKVLLLIDGLEMHETIYSSLQFLQHYPIFNIKQIEIIRGPGSVIYGGNAELAVINIITKKGEENKAITINGQYGQLDKTYARRQAAISIGNSLKNGLTFNIFGLFNQGNLSSSIIPATDSVEEISYLDSSRVSGVFINANMQYKQTEIKYIYDEHLHDVTIADFGFKHLSHIFNLKHTFKVNKRLNIVPQLFYKMQYPWNYYDASNDSIYNENYKTTRAEANVTAQFEASEKYSLLAGIRYLADHAEYYKSSSNVIFNYSGTNKVDYYNYAAFIQGNLKWKIFTLVPGFRFEKHNVYGAVIVPRVNLTKKIGKWNIDLQYNEAFRAPSILNIDLNKSIKPEKTYDKEIEVSYRIGEKSIASATLFHIDIINPIIYASNGILESYENNVRTGSIGIETEYKYKSEKHNFTINYSLYLPNNNQVDEFVVENKPHLLTAFPNHKATANYILFFKKGFFINVSSIFYSERFGYDSKDILFKLKPTLLLGSFIGFRNLFKALDVGLGVNDLLNENYEFIQAYRSGNDPLPGPGRELSLKIRYNINFQR
jgi:outer membrane receptor for ferrienterochelin and colicin